MSLLVWVWLVPLTTPPPLIRNSSKFHHLPFTNTELMLKLIVLKLMGLFLILKYIIICSVLIILYIRKDTYCPGPSDPTVSPVSRSGDPSYSIVWIWSSGKYDGAHKNKFESPKFFLLPFNLLKVLSQIKMLIWQHEYFSFCQPWKRTWATIYNLKWAWIIKSQKGKVGFYKCCNCASMQNIEIEAHKLNYSCVLTAFTAMVAGEVAWFYRS